MYCKHIKLQERDRKKKLLLYTVVVAVIACLLLIGSMTIGGHAVLLMKAWISYPVVAVITGFITFFYYIIIYICIIDLLHKK